MTVSVGGIERVAEQAGGPVNYVSGVVSTIGRNIVLSPFTGILAGLNFGITTRFTVHYVSYNPEALCECYFTFETPSISYLYLPPHLIQNKVNGGSVVAKDFRFPYIVLGGWDEEFSLILSVAVNVRFTVIFTYETH